ncbi:hypothetical protein P3C24_15755 [Pseudomonas proteolytica]|uniref:hypothetical protein n=1 Tax=Pseudomonas proteolytica TaxID=219574 RepID=UPI0023DE926A|nr:hypothetical protein [Pseudomonas proteolytica]MDF3162411.1 hypothetical protein [Pseudomonas proteolytica]
MDRRQHFAGCPSKISQGWVIRMMLERYIDNYLPASAAATKSGVYFDTASRLAACASKHDWEQAQFQTLEFLSKRIEISRSIYDSYLESGARASTTPLATELQPLALLLLFKDFQRLSAAGSDSSAIKRLNAVFRLLDYLSANKVVLAEELLSLVNTEADQFLLALQHTNTAPTEALVTPEAMPAGTLPLTVLFWEGPIARAYLATLKSMGLKPEKIIHLVARNDLSTKKPVGRFLPGLMKLAYAQSKQKNSIHHWSATLQKTETALYQGIRNTIESGLAFSKEVIDDALALGDLGAYCADIETLMIDNLADEALHTRLTALPPTQILFTGGGIVPKKLLEISALKFIHVHPGYLPDVRGADCALWSHIMKGRTSATCFYMAPGIDDGDVIFAAYLPTLDFASATTQTELKTLYRATYAFFDPWIRACVLRRSLVLTAGFTSVAAQPQSEASSVTYHFMHERIQRAAFDRMFPVARA